MRRPLFLARRAYRLRRLTDAARLLPVVGTFLVLLPVFWRGANGEAPGTVAGGVYLFAVWAGLILVAAVIARRLGRAEAQHDTPPADDRLSPTAGADGGGGQNGGDGAG